MDDLDRLEVLSLVNKVFNELKSHLGVEEKTLAEFIIAQRLESKDRHEFQKKLAAMGGAKWPDSLYDSIDHLVRTMHPKMKNQNSSNGAAENHRTLEEKKSLFAGLAIPDKPVPHDEIDDTLALLEDLAPKSRVSAATTSRKRTRSPRSPEDRDRDRGRRRRSRDRDYDDGDERRASKRKSRRQEYDDGFKRPPVPEVDNEPIMHKVYEGHVTGIKDFGAFVNLHGVRGKVDGMVHISQLVEGQRVNHPSDLLTKGQDVKVKVTKIEGNRIGLSMKEVDQVTGQDLVPQSRIQSSAKTESFGAGSGANSMALGAVETVDIQIQIRTPLLCRTKASDYPDLEEDYHATLRGESAMELEQDIDIEVRDEEPPFLVGQTKQSLELSPIRVVKAPDGSLNRAAMSGTNLAKERKEIRRNEVEAAEAASKGVDLSTQWNDPMANPDQKKFASDLRSAAKMIAPKAEAEPEWKRVAKSEPLGKRTNMTIKQQRETLPVYAFRDQLIKAVHENQFLIVVGETGSGKTTQLTQYLAEAGFANNGMIGCTQPETRGRHVRREACR
ncbi:helicase associated domain-containing protein [Apiospora arundinis]